MCQREAVWLPLSGHGSSTTLTLVPVIRLLLVVPVLVDLYPVLDRPDALHAAIHLEGPFFSDNLHVIPIGRL